MYKLVGLSGLVYGRFHDLRVAYANMMWLPYAIELVNDVTGEVLYNNYK